MGAPTLRIRLLGELDLRYDGVSLPPLESARAGSLLAYLLLHRQAPQPRQRLAFLLWPDSTESQARTNLRHVLHTLRRALPVADRFLAVTSTTLQWQANAPFWLDVMAFEEMVSRAEQRDGDIDLAALREAVELYTGDVFAGCSEEWLLGERERLRQGYLGALQRLTALLEARGQHAEAILYAERLLRQEPLHEETYRLLMRLHNARGDRARALRIYHQCAATLERELGIEPSAPTHEAYETLLSPPRTPMVEEGEAGRPRRSPLVGRLPERKQLSALWRVSATGGTHLVLVTGEPGIGKTRLIEEFRAWCIHRGAVSATARSYAAEGALAYAPLVEWLHSEPLKVRLQRLDRARLTELARLLPELLSEILDLSPPEPLPESDQRQRLFDATARAILAARGPLLLVADDLQWWDRESLQFLHYLLRVEPEARLLVAATARSEEIDHRHPLRDLRAGLHALGRFTEIDLGRLSREETATLAERVVEHPLAEPDADQLYRETEGNPLFVVEALRAGWMSGHARRGWTTPKVQAVIESRLGQLSEPAQDLVGVAATIGREFTSDVLTYASEADENTLVRSLDELWRRRIVREQGAEAYDFSHDKIREVAYLALSPARRRRHHLCVAHALEQLYAHDSGPVSGQIAGHYERAGAASQAVTWYQRAAAAQQPHSNIEAARLLECALGLIRTLPATSERDARELETLTTLLGPLHPFVGYGSSHLSEVQRRALDLAGTLGVEPASPLLRSLALSSLSTGDFEAACRAGEQLRARSERDMDDMLLVEAEYVLGIAAFWNGELDSARRHFEAAVGRYHPDHRHAHLLRYAQDPKVVCLSRLGNTLWFLGLLESATRARDAAAMLADEIGHSYSRSVTLVFAAILALEMRDVEQLREYLASLKAEHSQHEARHNQIISEAIDGYLDVLGGRKDRGIARIQRALDDSYATKPTPGHQHIVTRLLIDACKAAGDARAGLAAADRALAIGGARLWEAEVRRLRGEFLAALGASSQDVEMELGRALEVARGQGAKMLELRATKTLLRQRLVRGDGRGVSEARDALSAIVEALPEGRDTPDVRECIVLLARS